LAWAVGRTPWWRVTLPIWATITIIATPLFGGHYAIDVLAGAGLAVLALYLTPIVVSLSASSSSEGRNAQAAGSLAAVVRSDGKGLP